MLIRVRDHRLRDGAVVERVPAIRTEHSERICEIRVPEHVPSPGCSLAVDQPRGPGRGLLVSLERSPSVGDDRRHREAVLGIVDRGLEYLSHAHGAVLLQHLEPAVDGTGNGHRVDPPDPVHVVLVELLVQSLERHPVRRPTTRVEADQLLLGGDVDHDERITAQARAVRFHDREHRSRRDGCVDGIAARLQDVEPGIRRERLTRSHDAAEAGDWRPERLVVESFVFLCFRLFKTDADEDAWQQREHGREATLKDGVQHVSPHLAFGIFTTIVGPSAPRRCSAPPSFHIREELGETFHHPQRFCRARLQ